VSGYDPPRSPRNQWGADGGSLQAAYRRLGRAWMPADPFGRMPRLASRMRADSSGRITAVLLRRSRTEEQEATRETERAVYRTRLALHP